MNLNALELASRGFRVFPLIPGGKRPRAQGWQEIATNDPARACELVGEDDNTGVSTAGLFVLDVDPKNGGLAELERLRLLGPIPETYTVRTPSGGLHIYFEATGGRRYATRAYRRAPDGREWFALEGYRGIDIRAEGGLVVGAGSTFMGRAYTVERDVPRAPVPDWLDAVATQAATRIVARGAHVGDLDTDNAVARAVEYLKTAEPAVEGEGGDAHTIVTANRVLDEGVSVETATDLLSNYWNDRCSPPWEPEALAKKVESAARSRQSPIGSRNADRHFDIVEMPKPKSLLRFPADVDLAEVVRRQSEALVRGLLHRGDTAVIYGDSGAGKTFLGLDLAYHVVHGKPWHGHKTRAASVLYGAMEGAFGFDKRMLAAEKKHGPAGKMLAALAIPVSLVRSEAGAQGVQAIVAACIELAAASGEPVGMIVIDTLSRAIAGDDENAAETMSAFVEHRAATIARLTGAAVVIVHHKNKNGDVRGSTVLRGACDAMFRADRDGDVRELVAEKVKDGEDGKAIVTYSLEVHELAKDADGERVTSCTVLPIERPDRQCEPVLIELVDAALRDGVFLSPSPHAINFAPRWAFENRPPHAMFSAEVFEAAWARVASRYASETVRHRGKDVKRLTKIVRS